MKSSLYYVGTEPPKRPAEIAWYSGKSKRKALDEAACLSVDGKKFRVYAIKFVPVGRRKK